jgi:ribosome-binding protein aMBF1 (putative translation factor)
MPRKNMEAKKAELLARPEFKASYDALESEFALARTIIEARVRAGLTQEQVAVMMKTTQSAVARLESGKSVPSTATLQKFAKAIGSRLCISFQPAC